MTRLENKHAETGMNMISDSTLVMPVVQPPNWCG